MCATHGKTTSCHSPLAERPPHWIAPLCLPASPQMSHFTSKRTDKHYGLLLCKSCFHSVFYSNLIKSNSTTEAVRITQNVHCLHTKYTLIYYIPCPEEPICQPVCFRLTTLSQHDEPHWLWSRVSVYLVAMNVAHTITLAIGFWSFSASAPDPR